MRRASATASGPGCTPQRPAPTSISTNTVIADASVGGGGFDRRDLTGVVGAERDFGDTRQGA